MIKKTRILISLICVAAVLLSGSYVMISSAQETGLDFHKKMLENILTQRHWIVDVLVEDNTTTEDNPYHHVLNVNNGGIYLRDVLDNYENDDLYSFYVKLYDATTNAADYLRQYGSDTIALVANALGLIDDNELFEYIDNEIRTVSDKKYESILLDVMTQDYTATNGLTLLQEDSVRQRYSDMEDTLKKLNRYRASILDVNEVLANGLLDDNDEVSYADIADYADHFLDAHADGLYETVENLFGFDAVGSRTAAEKNCIAYMAFTFSLFAEQVLPAQDSVFFGDTIRNNYADIFAEPLKGFMSAAGKLLDLGSTTVKYLQMLHALESQYDTTVQTMSRIRQNTADIDLMTTIASLVGLVEEESAGGDYVSSVAEHYLRDKSYLSTAAVKALKKKGVKAIIDTLDDPMGGIYDSALDITAARIGSYLLDIGKGIKLGLWLGNAALNVNTSAKRTNVCVFVKKIIDAAVAAYRSDYSVYQQSQTDENAKKCLDDLEYLKRLRLYGEKNAYEAVTTMPSSIFVTLFAGTAIENDLEHIEASHKAYTDMLLGCTTAPMPVEFTVSNGEMLTVELVDLGNGRYVQIAKLTDADGTRTLCLDLNNMIYFSVNLSGGVLRTDCSVVGKDFHVFIPRIIAHDGTILIGSNSLYVNELYTSGNTEVRLIGQGSELRVTGCWTNAQNGSAVLNGADGATANAFYLQNEGVLSVNTASLDVNSADNNGSISGTLAVCGNGRGIYENGYSDPIRPTLSGSGTVSSLSVSVPGKEGALITGSQTVAGWLNLNGGRVHGSENLYATGSCALAGNRAGNALSFRDYTAPAALDLRGRARIFGSVSFPYGATFGDGIELTSSCNVLTLGADSPVKGDLVWSGGGIVGDGFLKLRGDMTVNVRDPNIHKLDFTGATPQKISSQYSLTAAELGNHNTSLGGVSLGTTVYVTGTLHASPTAVFENGKNLVLTGTAGLDGSVVKGSLSAKDWTVPSDLTVKGGFWPTGSISIPSGRSLTVQGYYQDGGGLTLGEGALLHTTGDWRCSASVTNAGAVRIGGDGVQSAAFTGGELLVKGDLTASAALKPDRLSFESRLPQQFSNSKETKVRLLDVSNSSSGMTFNSVVRVTENYDPGASRISGGRNIVYQGEGDVTDARSVSGDVTWQGAVRVPAGETVTIGGDLYISSGAAVSVEDGAELIVRRNLHSSGAALTAEAGGVLTVEGDTDLRSTGLTVNGAANLKGDCAAASCTLGGGGMISLKGDLNAQSCTWNLPQFTFEAATPQKFSSSNTAKLASFTLNNTSKGGVTLGCEIEVRGVYHTGGSTVVGGDKVSLTNETDAALPADVGGGVTLKTSYRVSDGETATVDGTLTLASGSSLTVPAGSALTVRRSLTCSGGSITVEEGGTLIVCDYMDLRSGTVTNDGALTVCGDAAVSGKVGGGGEYIFKGDLKVGGTWNSPNVTFESKLPQYVTGNTMYTNDFTINNLSRTGITLRTTVYYGGALTTGDSAVEGSGNLVKR